jgi:lysophospholipase L1-like esterase
LQQLANSTSSRAIWSATKTMRVLLLIPAALLLAAGCSHLPPRESGHDFGRWEKEIAAFERTDGTNPPPKGALLFIGSSTIRRWSTLAQDFPHHRVLNRGFGGSQIVDATHFAERIIFPYEPSMIFLRAGGNDLWAGKSVEEVFGDFKEFVKKVHARLPRAEIAFISLSPSIARWTQAEKEKALNQRVKSYCRRRSYLKYIETYSLPLGPDGQPRPELFVADKLHFNGEGYKLLVEAVRPHLPRPSSLKLPTRLLKYDGAFLLTAKIGEAGPFSLLIDTGASGLALSEGVARRLREVGLAQGRGQVKVFSSSGKVCKLDLVAVSNLVCGELVLGQAMAAVADFSRFSKALGEPLDGLAGLDLFSEGTLVLDYPAGEVWFEQAAARSTNGAVRLPLTLNAGITRVMIELSGHRFPATVDTGFDHGFSVPSRLRDLPLVHPPAITGLYLNMTEIGESKEARLGTNVCWGGLVFERPVIAFEAPDFGIIGLEVLRHFTVSLDQRHRSIWLKPGTNGPVTWPSVRSPGFRIFPSGAEALSFEVGGVLPGTEAARLGIHTGARITAINGEPVAEWSRERWNATIDHAETIEVELAEGEKSRRVKLNIRMLVE